MALIKLGFIMHHYGSKLQILSEVFLHRFAIVFGQRFMRYIYGLMETRFYYRSVWLRIGISKQFLCKYSISNAPITVKCLWNT
jgi:hypothetical protein